MPTDEDINAEENASVDAHSPEDDVRNDSSESHSDDSENSFDARRAFDATNSRVNKLTKAIEDLSEKLSGDTDATDDSGEPEKKEDVDLDALVDEKLWLSNNETRINENEAVKAEYQTLISKGIPKAEALELAEARNGVKVDSAEQNRQKKVSSTSASVDRTQDSVSSKEERDMHLWGYSKETLLEHKKRQGVR